MDDQRANPHQLLKRLQMQEEGQSRGQLKIFFGYAAGVGKTYAMLEAAHAAKQRGLDVVAGYVEPHARPQTKALLEGLETLPTKTLSHEQLQLQELDLDAAIQRKPQLILVDELAHTNAPGCRHTKRYQDVEELLKAGIDVYTTVNVQHLESLNDRVASITGVLVRERIPDRVFDGADQVELVDIEPQELIERLNMGQIYREVQAKQALSHFFSTENLVALREIALRRCADRVNKKAERIRQQGDSHYYAGEHILVCLSSSPTNAKILRTAARMADAFNARFTALFVETPDFPAMTQENRNRLRFNIHLAEQLGATVETVYGEDIALQISEFARLSGVSKIVVGRQNAIRRYLFSKPALTERLSAYAPNLDIYIIPDKDTPRYKPLKVKKQIEFIPADCIKSVLVLVLATIIGFAFSSWGFSEANTITIYILGVLVTAIITTRRMYSLVSSIISVLIFNFFFTDPRFTFNAYDSGYPVTFLIMFISAFITGTLAVKIKQHARQSAQTAFRAKTLFDTNQLLQKARGKENIVSVTAHQLQTLLNRDVVFYAADGGNLNEPQFFHVRGSESRSGVLDENEKAVALWVFKNNKHAGATTNTLSNAKCLYLAVRVNDNVYGVVGIVMEREPLDAFENSILLSILGECALAMENEQVAKEKEEAAILAKNEQLRANLLRSISHDLRTPLTSISGNAGILLANEDAMSPEKKQLLYQNIYDDSLWLINLVENLLSVTRIEDGTMNLKLSAELMDEVITEALNHMQRVNTGHIITVQQSEEFILAKMDARLIVQVLINLIDNAIKYTPKDSPIAITVSKSNGEVLVEIADQGLGIPDETKPRVFDMFYTAQTKIADSRRSLGLGLALCKAIISAHGGEITVADNQPCGTVFRFTLPAEEVTLHE